MLNVGVLQAILRLKDELSPALKKAADTVQKSGKLIGKALAAAAAVAAAAIAAAVVSVVAFGGHISDLASKTATTTKFLQEMRVAAGQVGVSIDTVAKASLILQRNIGDTGTASLEVTDALNAIGLSIRDLVALSPEEQFREVAKAIGEIENPAIQANAAMTLLGKGGGELLPLIRNDLQAVADEAHNLGIVLSGEVIQAADEVGDRFDILKLTLGATAHQLGGVIVQNEGFRMVIEALIGIVGSLNQFIIRNQSEISSWVTAGILVAASAIQGTATVVAAFVLGLGLLGETVLKLQKVFIDWGIVLLKSPIAATIPGVGLLREGMLSLAESMSESLADGLKFFAGVQKVGLGIDRAGVAVGDFKANLLNQIAAGKEATDGAQKLSVAVADVGDTAEISAKQIREQEKATREAAKAYQDLLAAANQQFEFTRQFNQELEIHKTKWDGAKDAIFAGSAATQEARIAAVAAAAGYKDMTVEIQAVELKSIDWGRAMDGVNDFLSETRGLMSLLGVSADSVFGKLVDWASKAFDAFNSLASMVDKLTGAFGSGGGLGSLLGGLGSLFGGGGGVPGGASLVSAGIGTAGVGAAATGAGAAGAGAGAGGIGAAISSGAATVMSGIGSALAAIPVAGWIALGGVGVGLLVKALFGGKSTFESVGEEMGRDWAAAMGTSMSRDLQFHVTNLAEDVFGGDRSAAFQASLGEITKEAIAGGRANFDLLAQKAADTYSFIERGQFTAAQGQTVLNESVSQLLPHLSEMGAEGVLQLERMLAAAQASGVSFSGMSELAAGYVQRANELGIAVNNVTLEALGLGGALTEVAQSGTENFARMENANAQYQASIATTEGDVDLLREALTEVQAAGNFQIAPGVSDQLRDATRNADALADAFNRAAAAGGGINPGLGGGRDFRSAQHGFHGDILRPTLFLAGERGRERVDISPAGGGSGGASGDGGAGGASITYAPSFQIDLSAGTPHSAAQQVVDLVRRDVGGLRAILKQELGVE